MDLVENGLIEYITTCIDGGWDSDESDGGKEELAQDPVSDTEAPPSSGTPHSTRKAKTIVKARLSGVLAANTEEAPLPQKRKQTILEYGNKATKKARGNKENL